MGIRRPERGGFIASRIPALPWNSPIQSHAAAHENELCDSRAHLVDGAIACGWIRPRLCKNKIAPCCKSILRNWHNEFSQLRTTLGVFGPFGRFGKSARRLYTASTHSGLWPTAGIWKTIYSNGPLHPRTTWHWQPCGRRRSLRSSARFRGLCGGLNVHM